VDPKQFTVQDLERWIGSQRLETSCGLALYQISKTIHSYCMEKGESSDETLKKLDDAKRIFNRLPRDTAYGVVPGSPCPHGYPRPEGEDIWRHHLDLHNEFFHIGYKDDNSFLYRPPIANLAAQLMDRPWIKSNLLEWVVVDSLICDEIRQFGKSILENAYSTSDFLFMGSEPPERRGLERILIKKSQATVLWWFIRIISLVLFPILTIWYGAKNDNGWLLSVGLIILTLYLLWSGYGLARGLIGHFLGRQERRTPLQRKVELWRLMNDAYRTLDGPIVDPGRVKVALLAAAEKGAVWDSAVYAILNRVMARDPGVWVTDDRHAY
jgi:hypothetical protein